MGMVKEFRTFAMKGNMVDMAVGIVIGGAFGLIIKSLIDDLLMPIVSIPGNVDFSNLYVPLASGIADANAALVESGKAPMTLGEAREMGPVLAWGNFTTIFINFLILAFAVFMVVRAMNSAKAKFEKEQQAAPPAAPPEDVVLLREIRDAIKASNG